MANTILIMAKDPHRKEDLASETITPGQLIDFVPSGTADAGKLQVHGTAGGFAVARFAVESFMKSGPGKAIDATYAADENLQYGIFRAGDEVFAFLAPNQSVGRGDPLTSNGSGGSLKAAGAGDFVVATVKEGKTSAASAVRIVVEIA